MRSEQCGGSGLEVRTTSGLSFPFLPPYSSLLTPHLHHPAYRFPRWAHACPHHAGARPIDEELRRFREVARVRRPRRRVETEHASVRSW